MSDTFKLARGSARLRAVAAAGVVLATAACNPEESSAPTAGEAGVTTAVATPAFLTSASAPGIPFGDFHLPVEEFDNPRYTGSLQALWPSSTYSRLDAARSNGKRVIISLAGSPKYYRNSDGTFNLTKWKSRIDVYRGYNFSQYVSAGTVIGHYLVDESFCAKCWGGKTISYSQIEEMSRYSKSLWPTLPTGVRAPPSLLGSTRYSSLDFGWAQWEGPLHVPSYRLTPEQFRDQETARARSLGLGLVFGLNYLDGGDGTSRIQGTYAPDPNLSDTKYCESGGKCYRYAMSATEVRRVGKVFAAAAYGCAVLNWPYNTTFLSRSGMKAALDEVVATARNRSRTSCKQ